MAQTEDIVILKVGTEEAVKSVNDLKTNIKELKKNLGELNIGSQEYQDTLEELTINQNALKDAMHGTTATMQDVAAAATGVSESYNGLVHRMAALKEEWRATNDEARRNELGKQIDEINQRLKNMDASVGNFSRNVGNYESGFAGIAEKFDTWGETLKSMPPTLGPVKESLGQVGETMQLVGKQPILGIVGLLAPIIMKIVEALKENETAMGAVKKIMDSLQPVFDFVNIILEKIAQGFALVVDKIIGFVASAEPIKKVVSVIAGVGNSILQYLLTPIKSAVEAFKGLGNIMKDVFTGKFGDIKKHAKEAGQGIADAWKEGLSFKANFEVGQEMGSNFVEGIKSSSNKEEAKTAGEELGDKVKEGTESKFVWDESIVKKVEAESDARLQAKKKAQEEEDAFMAEIYAEDEAEIEAFFEEQAQYEENARIATENAEAKKREAREKTLATMDAAASATSGILSSLADMMESDEKNAEKNAKKVKALRIASATIDMLNGAVGAFASAASNPGGIPGMIIGAVNAASVVAMGIANINKIKATNVENPPEGGGTPSATPASVSPPNIDTQLMSVRNVTSASEEDRLNQMASSQKVYILQSDIEAAGHQSKVQVAETSF